MFLGKLNIENGELEYCSAGHCRPYKLGEKIVQLGSTNGIPIGIDEKHLFKTKKIKLQEKEKVIIYTDGLTEARNINREFFGEEKLENVMRKIKKAPIKDILKHIMNSVNSFTLAAKQSDDITILAINWKEKL